MSRTITVFSNKGGVGKTFIAANLATVMGILGKKTLLVDFDFHAGHDLARMLNLFPKYSIVDILPKLEQAESPEIIKEYTTTHTSGIDFLPTVNHLKQVGHVTPENIQPFFKKVSEVYDYIIVDGGKTFSETLVTVLDYSNLILLVATPDVLAVYQIKWSLDVLQSLHFPSKMVKLVLNRSESRGSVAWQEVRSAIPCEIFGHIPSDGKIVGMALNRGVPCVIDSPKSKVAESFIRMANIIVKEDPFIPTTEIEKLRTRAAAPQNEEFWKQFGVAPIGQSGMDMSYV